jgi:hypothetical protein
MKRSILLVLVVSVLFLSGCADVENVQQCVTGRTYGFWGGLWHGIIAPVSFIGQLFSDDIAIWAVNNNGGWYAFGFILGSGILGAGVSSRKS